MKYQSLEFRGRIGVLVACVAGICALVVVLLPLEVVIRHVKDDSFYYLQTARNIVTGYGSTFDRINPTNGYHPLWMLNILPIYAALPNEPLFALRVVLLVVATYHASATLILYVLLARLHGPWVGALASLGWALSPVVLRINLNGMESGLYALLLSAFIVLVTQRCKTPSGGWHGRVSTRDCLVTGVFAMLCVMARLDAVLVLAGLGIVLLGIAATRRTRSPLLMFGSIVAPTVIVLLGYMGFNLVQFGIPLPVSGLVKRPELPHNAADILSQLLWPLGPLIRRVGLWMVAGLLVLAVALGGVHVARVRWMQTLLRAAFERYDWLWVGCALLYVYISFSKTYIANWYYVPMFLLATLVFAELLALAARAQVPRIVKQFSAALLVTGMVSSYGLLATTEFNPRKNDTIYETLRAAYWIRDNLPKDVIGASWSAGVLAYFSERPIINLDGLINSNDYYQAMTKGRAPQFVLGEGASYVFDMFPVPPSGNTIDFSPDTAWNPFLMPYYEYRYSARNVGISSLFKTIFPESEQDALFMWKVWRVRQPN